MPVKHNQLELGAFYTVGKHVLVDEIPWRQFRALERIGYESLGGTLERLPGRLLTLGKIPHHDQYLRNVADSDLKAALECGHQLIYVGRLRTRGFLLCLESDLIHRSLVGAKEHAQLRPAQSGWNKASKVVHIFYVTGLNRTIYLPTCYLKHVKEGTV